MNEYLQFLERKKHSIGNYGIEPNYLPPSLFDYQNYVAEYAIRKGRCAVFLDTGLGKTLIELVIAANYAKTTNKPVLIITPLAVAFQFIKEAERFGIDDISHSKDGKYKTKIVVCNYERLQYFDSKDFDCVILDESSILKNFDGALKGQITAFLKKVKYRYLFTATPSPNDFIELGTSSEALGYMGYMDMMQKFFANNENNIRPQEIATKWYLKPHAEDAFFEWVSSWSISMRKPSDLGFDDSKHVLPELITNYHAVKNENNMVLNGQILMFNMVAQTMTEVKTEQKQTIESRCERAIDLKTDVCVYWCHFNQESELLHELDPVAYEIKGSMNLEHKEDILNGFANGEIKRIITKPRITAFGLNWQHCNHTIYFPNWSYEQYYQSIRRFWRFGQKNEVICDLVYSDGQKRVIDALQLKQDKANDLYNKLNSKTNGKHIESIDKFTTPILKPKFL
jgi:hypothetical protein